MKLHALIFLLRRALLALAMLTCSAFASSQPADSLGDILAEIERLEGASDPKCYATASRLEDFMFGTPLSDQARFGKNLLQKQWAKDLWLSASAQARNAGKAQVGPGEVKTALQDRFAVSQTAEGHWQLQFPDDSTITIHKNDQRQYGSVAYSLRALLAVQQEQYLDPTPGLIPLAPDAVTAIKNGLDLFTLSVLKLADNKARMNDVYEVDLASLNGIWQSLDGERTSRPQAVAIEETTANPASAPEPAAPLSLLNAIIEQKVKSYAAYNEISNQLFVRNLQVYFARNRWPAHEEEATRFRNLFTEILIAFAADLYTASEALARNHGERVIREEDVRRAQQDFIPHTVNEYEDVRFFPRLDAQQQVFIESYDLDAFRDSGIHWRYLQFAVNSPDFTATLEPDPYAAELLVENIAQFGMLVLRETGARGKALDEKRLAVRHMELALSSIQQRINQHAAIPVTAGDATTATLRSSKSASAPSSDTYFTEQSAALGLDYEHRSSDWLNRLLRSYLKKDEHVGIITIPPAFGGAGVAAEDINNDGFTDILILGGTGNRLYLNRKGKGFEDITRRAGLDWRRAETKLPGEPRQPLIADLDNDGLQDIVITYVDDEHRVYRNLGDSRFEDVTASAGLGGKSLVGGPATVFDFDNDGLLDLYVTYFGDYLKGVLPTLQRRNFNGLSNKLFRNLGNFRFEDVTAGSGTDNTGWGQAVTHTDLDGDGLQDLIVGNDFGVNAYLKNMGGGRFTNIAGALGTEKPSYTMSIGLTDLNADRLPDIYISNIVTMNKDEKYVMPAADTTAKFNPDKLANMRVVEANDLFLSSRGDEGSIAYTLSSAVGRGYSSTGWSWDADFFDMDNDGDDDLYVVNGMNEFNLYSSENPYYTDPIENQKQQVYIPVATRESNVLFLNEESRLKNVSGSSGTDLLGNSRSAAYLDHDRDGDLDIVLNNYHGRAVYYRNNAEQGKNNWLTIRLVGNPAVGVNLDAIGTRIIARTGDHSVWREVHGSIGYMSVHPKEQHFGLGSAATVDLEITWPNGQTDTLQGVSANQHLVHRLQARSTGDR